MSEQSEYRMYMTRAELHKSLSTLAGILEGILSDGVVRPSEQDEIANWYSLHRFLLNVHPFKEILPALDSAFEDGRITGEEAEDILWLCRQFLDEKKSEMYYDSVTESIQYLQGILHGILADCELNDLEIESLNDWLNDNDFLCGTYPFDEIYGLILAAKEDGVISEDERNMLKAYFSTFIDTRESFNIHAPEVSSLQQKYSIYGICAVCPDIEFNGRVFCFTGSSGRAKRDDFRDIIERKGGVFTSTVTKKTDYLIVGDDGNPCWAFSCYGRKVEKAMGIRRDGGKVVICHENDFWDSL